MQSVKIKYHNVTINGQNFYHQPVKNNTATYNILKITTGQGDDYATIGYYFIPISINIIRR